MCSQSPPQTEPSAERIYRDLRADIMHMRLEPGEPLHEVAIARRFGLSRTPVREAFRRLESEGLVVMTPKRGSVVSEISLRSVIEAYQVREQLEPFAAAQAAERASREALEQLEAVLDFEPSSAPAADEVAEYVQKDIDFHDAIMAMAGNETLRRVVADMRARSQRVQFFVPGGRPHLAWHEHRRILAALKSGDTAASKISMQEHLAKAKARLVE